MFFNRGLTELYDDNPAGSDCAVYVQADPVGAVVPFDDLIPRAEVQFGSGGAAHSVIFDVQRATRVVLGAASVKVVGILEGTVGRSWNFSATLSYGSPDTGNVQAATFSERPVNVDAATPAIFQVQSWARTVQVFVSDPASFCVAGAQVLIEQLPTTVTPPFASTVIRLETVQAYPQVIQLHGATRAIRVSRSAPGISGVFVVWGLVL